MAFIKDFAAAYVQNIVHLCSQDQLVTLSKIYIMKLQHAKPKKCSRDGYVPEKVE